MASADRVALARALVSDPRILLLDEATSALDARTERQISRTLERVGAGRTTIAVTHRLASVTGYDQIVVVVEGRFAEVGTHDELRARGGVYARLWAEQTGAPLPTPAPFDLDTALARISLFAGLDDAARAEVAAHMHPLRGVEGDVLAQGADVLVVVTEGRARSTQEGPAGPVTRALGPGDVFGLDAALGQGGPATLTAADDVVACALDAEDLDALATRHPAIATARSGRTGDAPRTGHLLSPSAGPLIRTPPPRMRTTPHPRTPRSLVAAEAAPAAAGATVRITLPGRGPRPPHPGRPPPGRDGEPPVTTTTAPVDRTLQVLLDEAVGVTRAATGLLLRVGAEGLVVVATSGPVPAGTGVGAVVAATGPRGFALTRASPPPSCRRPPTPAPPASAGAPGSRPACWWPPPARSAPWSWPTPRGGPSPSTTSRRPAPSPPSPPPAWRPRAPCAARPCRPPGWAPS